ncbi:MAG: hypothetical protein Q9169_008741, partial [Polycauliona sp. 2 TL-2023]
MTADPLSYRIMGAVVAFLISVFLLAHHISFCHPSFLQTSSTSFTEESFGYPRSPPALNKLDSVSNTNIRDVAESIVVQNDPRNYPVNSSTEHRLAKRVDVLSYPYAVCKGRLLWNQIQNAFNGQRPPGPQFGRAEFDEAWSLNPEPNQGLPAGGHWDNAFKSFSDNVLPDPEFIFRRVAVQSKPFKNLAGRQVVTPTGGRHDILYVPGWSAMLATNVQSPSARLADADDSPYGHAVDEKDIPSLIPPMHRLSDVS